MKNSIYKATALGLAMIFSTSVLVMNGCKNPAEDIKVAISTSSLSKANTLIRIVKANPAAGAALPAQINVTISGPGKDFVQTDDGKKTFVASEGVLPLSLSRLANPSEASPVVFTVSVNVPGYAPILKQVSISNNESSNITLPLVSFANPVEGTAVSQTEKPLTGGVSVAETKIETTATATTPQNVEVSIPAGTQVQDANKQPINATSVKTTMVYYGTNDVEALQAVSSFMTAVNPIGPNNQTITGEVSFVTAGAISINMTAGTTAVKNFSKPMTAEIEINPALINPITGVAVKAGDVIPVWSLEESTGQWKYENTTTVANSGGKLVANINIAHLSTWALNWYNEVAHCNTSFNVTMAAPLESYVGYQIQIVTASGQVMVNLTSDVSTWKPNSARAQSQGGLLTGNSFSRILPGKIVVYSRNGDPTSKVFEQNVSGCGVINIAIPAPEFTDFIDTELRVQGNCTNKNAIVYPTSSLVLNDVTGNYKADLRMIDGKVNIRLKNGHTYFISAIYNNKTYKSENVKIDRTSEIRVSNASSGLLVTGKYDAGTKILPLKAVMPVSDCK